MPSRFQINISPVNAKVTIIHSKKQLFLLSFVPARSLKSLKFKLSHSLSRQLLTPSNEPSKTKVGRECCKESWANSHTRIGRKSCAQIRKVAHEIFETRLAPPNEVADGLNN